MRHARILQTQMGRAMEEMDLLRQASFGPLVVGVTPVAAAALVPRALGQLRRQLPSLAIRVHETVFKEGMEGLLNGSLDLMVGPIGVYPPVDGIEEQRLTMDPFTIVVRNGHPLSKRRSVSLRQLGAAERSQRVPQAARSAVRRGGPRLAEKCNRHQLDDRHEVHCHAQRLCRVDAEAAGRA